MFEPYSIPFWTALAAFAGVGQVVVLLVTPCFVYRYLQETAELRRTAQRQVEAAGDQLEAQIRPVIVARSHTKHQSLMLQNVGKGAAFNLRLTKVDPGFPVIWGTESNFATVLTGSYLETGVLPEDEVHGAVSAPSFFLCALGAAGNLRKCVGPGVRNDRRFRCVQ